MFAEERQRETLEILKRKGKASVEALAEEFGVSLATIRADLAHLEGRNLLRRTHGGALPLETTVWEPPYAEREQVNHPEKARIAVVAANLVHDHETVILDAGTTNYEIAMLLKGKIGLTVVTNSYKPPSLTDSAANRVEVILIGGSLHPSRRATLGHLAAEFLQRIYVDRAFIGVNGVHADTGYTVVDFDAADVKRAMIARARQTVVVADQTKLGKSAFASIGPLSIAHALITDTPVEDSLVSALGAAQVEVLVAE